MASARALYVALDLARVPTLAGLIRLQPLPPGVLMLVKIGAGSREALDDAVSATGASPDSIREAAAFYLEQALFAPEADSYRTLGVAPDASQETLREHMRWLMKWLHPDRSHNDWEAVFAERVLAAWQDVKSPERRANYNRTLRTAPATGNPNPARGPSVPLRLPWRIEPVRHAPGPVRWRRGAAVAAVAAAVIIAALLLPYPNPWPWGTVLAGRDGGTSSRGTARNAVVGRDRDPMSSVPAAGGNELKSGR